ncbi:MAG: nucleotidyltransferase domain-containing protein [Candidatus Altiarchaeales archaeon]|nr:nucleotidyltransferase domain-containing protein [Candidatus Altiarchaeales archaeon]
MAFNKVHLQGAQSKVILFVFFALAYYILCCLYICSYNVYTYTMETLIKECKPRGNSASVYVPKDWENQLVKVSLLSPRELILEVLKPHLQHIKGVYVYGSYVRGEAKGGSDIDALVVVSKKMGIISKKPLELIVATEEELRATLNKYPIPLKSILNEAQVLINDELLERLQAVEIDKQRYIDLLNETIERAEKYAPVIEREQNIRAIVYSLMLRLRAVYHLELMKEGGKYTHRDFREYVLKCGLDEDAYEELCWVYRMVRDKKAFSEAKITLGDIKKLNAIVRVEAGRVKEVLDVQKKKAS